MAAVVVVIGAWAAVVAVQLVRADHQLRLGTATAEAVRSELSTADLTSSVASTNLRAAADEFRAAHGEVSGTLFSPLGVLPIVGTQVHSVADLSSAAATVTGAGAGALDTARALFLAPHHTPVQRTRVAGRMATALASLDSTLSKVDLGPVKGLILTLADKRDTFAADLAKVRAVVAKADGASAALAALLRGPSTELVAATNNAEMRDGSGMILQTGSLSVRNGRFTVGAFRSVGVLADAASTIRPPAGIQRVWGFLRPATDFRALLLSPQVPANDALAAQMWKARTGQAVDGVVTVDVAALADLLDVTGPVTVGTTTYTSGSVTAELLVDQYAGLTGGGANAARRDQLGRLAAAVVGRLQQGGYSLSAMVTALDQAVNGRHLTVWSADPTVEAEWAAAGASGQVGGDSLLLGLLNLGGDKLDPYQKVTAALTTAHAGGKTDVTVSVRDTNATPSSVTGYAAGGGPTLGPPRTYTGAITLSFPLTASSVRTTGGPVLTGGRDGSSDQLAVKVRIAPGSSATVTFRFVLPDRAGSFAVLPSARLPATTWTVSRPGSVFPGFTDDTTHHVPW